MGMIGGLAYEFGRLHAQKLSYLKNQISKRHIFAGTPFNVIPPTKLTAQFSSHCLLLTCIHYQWIPLVGWYGITAGSKFLLGMAGDSCRIQTFDIYAHYICYHHFLCSVQYFFLIEIVHYVVPTANCSSLRTVSLSAPKCSVHNSKC